MKQSTDHYGRTPLHYAAAQADHAETLRLVQAGAEVNPADRYGWTPLHFAAQANAVEVSQTLLDSGAELDARDNDGNSPLWRAVFASRGEGALIALLRARGADVHAANNHGSTPLGLARTIGNYDVRQHFADVI